MIEPIIEFFEKLITQFSWRRLFFILIVIFISIGVLAWYETYTGHFRLNKIERTAKLLAQLTDLSEKIKKEDNSKLTNIFEGITKDLDMYVNHPVTAFSLHPAILKAMAAATLWILMILGFLLTKDLSPEKCATCNLSVGHNINTQNREAKYEEEQVFGRADNRHLKGG